MHVRTVTFEQQERAIEILNIPEATQQVFGCALTIWTDGGVSDPTVFLQRLAGEMEGKGEDLPAGFLSNFAGTAMDIV